MPIFNSFKYVANSGEKNFALASDKSSTVNLYHNASYQSLKGLSEYPVTDSLHIENICDSGEGIFVVDYYKYVNNETKYYLAIYDISEDKLLVNKEVGFNIDTLAMAGGKILTVDNQKVWRILDYSGEILEEFEIADKLREEAKTLGVTYYNDNIQAWFAYKDSVVVCTSCEIFSVDMSVSPVEMHYIYYTNGNSWMSDFDMSGGFVTFVMDESDGDKLAYFKDGDRELSYVKENGEDKVFAENAISSVVNTSMGEKIAFISKEGYIGVYTYGDENITKIHYPIESVSPELIKFTPDGNSIIAMCSGGKFIRYDLRTLNVAGEYKIDNMSYSTSFFFIDDTSFIINKGSSIYGNAEVIDIDAMRKVVEIEEGIVYFLQSDKKILVEVYTDDYKRTLKYFDYLSADKIIERARAMVEEK